MAELPPDIDFDPALDFDEAGEEEFPEEASNRPFIIASLALGGLFIAGLICIGVYLVVFAPRQRDAAATEAAAILAQNTQAVIDAQLTANADAGIVPTSDQPTATVTEPLPSTATPMAVVQVTDTPVVAQATETNTNTPLPPTESPTAGPSPTPSNTPTRLPTIAIGAATATVTPFGVGGGGETPVPGASSPTPGATALPDTGFADEVGVPALVLAALGLIAVMVVARRIRLAGS